MAEKIDAYEDMTTPHFGTIDLNGIDDRNGMAFVASSNYTIGYVELYIQKFGAPEGILTISIRLADALHKPTGGDLVSGTFNTADLPLAHAWTQIDFSTGYALTKDVEYCIVAKATGVDASNLVAWMTNNDDVSLALSYSINGGTTWNTSTVYNNYYRTYGGGSTPTDKTYSKKLVAVGNNEVWYESVAGTMAELAAANGDIDTSFPLSMFEVYQKLFIINKSNLKIADFVNVKITTADLGVNPPDHGTLLTGTSGAKMVVDYITNLDDNEACTIYGKRTTTTTFPNADPITGLDDDGNAISFSLNAAETSGPFWYNYTTYGNAAGDDTTYGALPSKATLGCLYRGRVVVSGDPNHPNEWYMSRQAHPFDFVVTSADVQSAVAGNNTDAGEVGDIVTCLIPYKDDYLVFGCANTIWLLTGDPRSGGTLGEFSLTTGIFGAQSFCWDNQDNLYFWGVNGIYKATVPGNIICLTKDVLPNIVADEAVSASTHRITMAYDEQRHGIQICITVLATGVNSNYFYGLASEGFFPESYPAASGVFSLFNYDAENPTYRKMIMGCNDGYLRYFNNSLKSDNDAADVAGVGTVEIDSHVAFGPLQMGDTPAKEGKLTGLILVSAGGASGGSDSDNIDCEVFVAWSAEEIIEKLIAATRAPNFSKTITAPGRSRGNSLRRKIRGVYAGLRLGNNTVGETWGFEQLIVDSKVAGRLK